MFPEHGCNVPLAIESCAFVGDANQRFYIDVNVHNRTWGPLFGYRSAFDGEWRHVEPNTLPAHLRPMRTEQRD